MHCKAFFVGKQLTRKVCIDKKDENVTYVK